MLKIGDFLNLSSEELREKETGLRKELMQLRFQAKTGKLERQNSLKETKRSIARILTVLSQRRLEDAAGVKTVSAKPAKKEKAAPVKKEKVEAKKTEKKTEAKAKKPAAKSKAKKG